VSDVETPPPEVNLERPTGRSRKWIVRVNGCVDRIDVQDARDRRRGARALGLDPETGADAILAAVTEAEAADPEPEAEAEGLTWPFAVLDEVGECWNGAPLDTLLAAIASTRGDYLRWLGGMGRLCAVDLDVLPDRRYGDTEPWEEGRQTGADLAWLTRSGGLRLIFVEREGVSALGRALLGIYLSGLAWDERLVRVELLSRTRPPTGRIARRSDPACAALTRAAGRDVAELDPGRVEVWLAEHGLERGVKAEHHLCPINPGPGSPSVQPLDRGVWCHRCQRTAYYSTLLGDTDEIQPHWLETAARERVHAIHVEAILAADWPPALPTRAGVVDLPRELYRAAVRALGEQDPDVLDRIDDRACKWLRGEGGSWLRSGDLRAATVSREGLSALSWARSRAHLSRLGDTEDLEGYRPVRICSTLLRPDKLPQGVVALQRYAYAQPMTSSREAFDELRADYPGISRDYLQALLGACACAEGGGMPRMLLCWGPSGSGKTQTIRIASSLLGATPANLGDALVGQRDTWVRAVGEALASGDRPLCVNEVDKIPALHTHVAKLLDLADPVDYRPLFQSRVRTAFRAPLVLTCITPPEAVAQAEVGRRLRLIHLPSRVPREWTTDPGEWLPDGPHAAAVARLVCDTLDLARSCHWEWPRLADRLGLLDPLDVEGEDSGVVRDLRRALFSYCCSGQARPSQSNRWPATSGWLDLNAPGARAILDELLPDVRSGTDARWVLSKDLCGLDWQTLLGLPVPVVWEQRQRGMAWVGRFREAGTMRGRGRTNGDLPEPVGE